MSEERPLTRKTIVYRVIRAACILYLGLRHRMKVEGLEHVPRKGGALIVSNHQSYLDIALIAAAVPRHVSFVARRSLADSKPLAFIMSQCGARSPPTSRRGTWWPSTPRARAATTVRWGSSRAG